MLLTTTSTFLYIEQSRLISVLFPDRVRQTQVFGLLDAAAQALTIFVQVSSPRTSSRGAACGCC